MIPDIYNVSGENIESFGKLMLYSAIMNILISGNLNYKK